MNLVEATAVTAEVKRRIGEARQLLTATYRSIDGAHDLIGELMSAGWESEPIRVLKGTLAEAENCVQDAIGYVSIASAHAEEC